VRRITARTFVIIAAIALAVAAFAVAAHATFAVGPVRVSAAITPGVGATSLGLPPFGSVEAATHLAPLRVELRLTDASFTQLEAWVSDGVPDTAAIATLRKALYSGLARAFLTGLLAALLAAALVLLAARVRTRTTAIVCAALTVALVGCAGWAALGFDEGAFSQPTYKGVLAYAPGIVSTVQQRLTEVDSLSIRIAAVARDLSGYYAASQTLASGGTMPNTLRVLHISDTHLDPVGSELARQLATSFDVAFVIHTGDADLYGTSVEASAVVATLKMPRPLVYIPGNHDSPDVVAALRTQKDVTVLDDTSTVVDGLRIFGVPDPVSRGFDIEPDKSLMTADASKIATALRSAIASGETTPDIIALHNPVMQTPFLGLSPIMLTGHTHTARLQKKDGVWLLNAGTTGGVQFGNPSGPHTAYTAAVLYYSATTPHKLLAIDRISIDGVTRETSLRRTLVDDTATP